MSGYRRRRRFGPVPRTHFLCLVSLVIQNSSLEGGFSDASLFPSWHQSKSKSAWASINTALHIRLANNLCCRNITVCIKITPFDRSLSSSSSTDRNVYMEGYQWSSSSIHLHCQKNNSGSHWISRYIMSIPTASFFLVWRGHRKKRVLDPVLLLFSLGGGLLSLVQGCRSRRSSVSINGWVICIISRPRTLRRPATLLVDSSSYDIYYWFRA